MQARRVYVRACRERSRSAAVSPTSAPAPANAALPRGFKSRSAPVGVPQFARVSRLRRVRSSLATARGLRFNGSGLRREAPPSASLR
ncbi:hypothetical protein HPB50_004348 [Hyalomma asiaticum]|uniref:Uncharacterized protein n=1 Tax=Hyalomma asiaticum TaxID=266040 RepID=A0ACB7SC39_HYAAI|nr:hypothetical protein HPB50_004348 [Hyalomma asiaticum]